MLEFYMLETTTKEHAKKPSALGFDPVLTQLSFDLSEALKVSDDPKQQIKHISEKTGVHVKTLNRLVNLENKPTPLTVFKIYKYFTQSETEAQVLNLCPAVIKKYLGKYKHLKLEKNPVFQPQLSNEIQTNPVFCEIYLLASVGSLSEIEIQNKFGHYGLRIATEMEAKKVLRQARRGQYTLGSNQIQLSPECVYSLGLQAIKSFAKPENGYELDKQFIGFMAEGLSEDAYRRWLKIDSDAYKMKIEIAQDLKNVGPKKAFAFAVVDTLTTPERK